MRLPPYRVLYFIRDTVPTDEQRDDILNYGPHAAFRNALYVGTEGAVEACTAVTGAVPTLYKRHYPDAVSYDDYRKGLLPEAPTPPAAPEDDADARAVDVLPPPPSGDPFAPRAPLGSPRQQAEWAKNGA